MVDANSVSTEIRRAQIGDAAELARLSAQLGYPLPPAEMTRRLAKLLTNDRHLVAIAARELSHPFCEALGYSRDKTQHVYSKALKTSEVECRT